MMASLTHPPAQTQPVLTILVNTPDVTLAPALVTLALKIRTTLGEEVQETLELPQEFPTLATAQAPLALVSLREPRVPATPMTLLAPHTAHITPAILTSLVPASVTLELVPPVPALIPAHTPALTPAHIQAHIQAQPDLMLEPLAAPALTTRSLLVIRFGEQSRK
jgi:hypothetical protein